MSALNRRQRRQLGIKPLDLAQLAKQGTEQVVRRGVMTPERRAEYVAAESRRRGLTDAERDEWLAAGGYTAWLHEPRWTSEDANDGGDAGSVSVDSYLPSDDTR